ncbi:EamA family transporter [Dyadobacter psychrophilus]|uniref:Permease of the drug/metabolite transporter (DMT) superfamily n=1 Tax=Dyadobacter psychrophilus TaxID=651661 RepID=A0A1T5DTU4_9BACT|nr:EamA family transporter [Dyadobacter psychrophilus]SKB74979.1 Permease of the drug/metabolite transporter (DMT) superfamily [Dyadobacter psychrophilus]
MQAQSKAPSTLLVVLAFATVYIVWGSTYFFIQRALEGFPPFFLGAFRFITAGVIMLIWSLFQGENVFSAKAIKPAIITGLLLLFVGNGIVIWVEQFLPSAMVAIMISSSPLWFILLDKPKWSENLSNKSTIVGLLIGFAGVVLLFSEKIMVSMSSLNSSRDLFAMALVVFGSMAWAGGSLYSKYKSGTNSATVNSTWQMLAAGIAFLPGSIISGELTSIDLAAIPLDAWLATTYLIIFGSIAGFGAYVWLLKVQPATKVSTYAYVNPVVAVLLGIFFAKESISILQIVGLVIILGSVLLINLHKYRKPKEVVSAY